MIFWGGDIINDRAAAEGEEAGSQNTILTHRYCIKYSKDVSHITATILQTWNSPVTIFTHSLDITCYQNSPLLVTSQNYNFVISPHVMSQFQPV